MKRSPLQIRTMEQDLESEQRRHQETDKNLRKVERHCKELEFQVKSHFQISGNKNFNCIFYCILVD